MNEKKVSIIIPVYKTEKFLDSCVHSALIQRYTEIEIILVDDGSPDNCPQLCDRYAERFSTISVVHQKNQGLGIARNTGMEHAKGEYVFFLDSDDRLDGPDAIACLAREADRTGADITIGNYRKFRDDMIMDVNRHHLHAEGSYPDTADFRFEGFYRYGNLAYNWGKLYRRSFLINNDLKCRAYPFTQDKAHNMLCYAYHPKYAFVDDSVYLYRVNEESVTFRYKKNLMPVWIAIAEEFHEDLKKRGMPDHYSDLTAFHIFFGSFFIVKQELQAGKGIFRAASEIRKYGKNAFVRKAMSELAKGRYVEDISNRTWEIAIQLAAILFRIHGYFLFTIGIAMLRGLNIDGKITEKRNKIKGKKHREYEKKRVDSVSLGLCQLLSGGLTGQNDLGEKIPFDRETETKIIHMAQQHRVLPMMFDVLEKYEEQLSEESLNLLYHNAERTVKQSYRLLFLTKEIVTDLEAAGLQVLVLKGSGVAACYPVPEYRKSGDVDLLLENAESIEKAGEVLKQKGYLVKEEQHANHHVAYQGPEGIDIELHAMLAEPFDDERINQNMRELQKNYFEEKRIVVSMGVELPVTSDPLQALELLLHMLQHFLRAGFGLRLLADWVVFWNCSNDRNTAERFTTLAEKCGVTGFAKAVTLVCEKYLGLQKGRVYDADLEAEFTDGYAAQFLMDIVHAEEFGKADPTRMVALRKRGFFGYIKEFHYQMKLNYPQESRSKWKWPALWIRTFMVFIENNRRLGRGSLGSILRSAGDRASVVEEMKLFQ
ncbi:MAG: nucleotidyltransferase family protein [Lachnospiraceae bacterium]|nr:nucleotidyltransferase family protein [Lachnospiraceae bacterium]